MLEKFLRWIVLGGIFALPFVVFIVSQSLFFPYITGKNFAFRIIVEIITAAWFVLALIRPEYRPRASWLLSLFAIFIGVVLIADLQGVYVSKSIWSNFERMDGWVTLAHLFAYFVVLVSVMSTEKLWNRLWATSIGVSVLVGMHALLQLIGVAALGGGGATGLNARLDARFGNPIYLAAFMLFNIFLTAFLWAQHSREVMKNRSLAYVYAAVIAFDTIILFFTGTRGTILGLIGGVILAAVLLAFFNRHSERVRKFAVGTLLGIFLIAGGFWLIRDAQWIQNVGFLQRLATISLSDNTVKARFINWSIAWEGVKERPLLGWGQENYAVVFDKYYDPRMYGQEQWFDRVHNIVFDWLVAGGFLALLSYLALFVCALYFLWRRTPEGSKQTVVAPFSILEKSVLTGLLAGYFFHNLFVFDNISSYILFTTVIAYIAWRNGVLENAPHYFHSKKFFSQALPAISFIAVVLLWGVAWGVNGKALAQNRALLRAVSPQDSITKNFDSFKEAIFYNSFGTQEAREQLTQVAFQVSGNQNIPQETKQQILRAAAEEINKQAQASPLDARPPLFLGALLGSYGDYVNAEVALKHALSLSPKKQTIFFELGQNAAMQGNAEKSLSYFKQALDLAPEFDNARLYYAAYAIRAGQFSLADEVLDPIIESGSAINQVIAAAYASQRRYDKIISIWSSYLESHPEHAQARFTLAAALYTAGRPTEAILQLQQAGASDPALKAQADALIEDIRNGTAKF